MGLTVEFRGTKKTLEWDDRYETILDMAEQNGIDIDSDCGIGVCGTCRTKLISGEVDMEEDSGLDDSDLDQNMILPCVSIPETDIIIDA